MGTIHAKTKTTVTSLDIALDREALEIARLPNCNVFAILADWHQGLKAKILPKWEDVAFLWTRGDLNP